MLPVLSQTALPSTLLADLNAARTYAQQLLSEATRTAYLSDWRSFEGWCADRRRSVARIPRLRSGVPGRHGRARLTPRNDRQTVCSRASLPPPRRYRPIADGRGHREDDHERLASFAWHRRLRRRQQRTLSQSAWSTPCRTIRSRGAATAPWSCWALLARSGSPRCRAERRGPGVLRRRRDRRRDPYHLAGFVECRAARISLVYQGVDLILATMDHEHHPPRSLYAAAEIQRLVAGLSVRVGDRRRTGAVDRDGTVRGVSHRLRHRDLPRALRCYKLCLDGVYAGLYRQGRFERIRRLSFAVFLRQEWLGTRPSCSDCAPSVAFRAREKASLARGLWP
jgi:hypothetical protein